MKEGAVGGPRLTSHPQSQECFPEKTVSLLLLFHNEGSGLVEKPSGRFTQI